MVLTPVELFLLVELEKKKTENKTRTVINTIIRVDGQYVSRGNVWLDHIVLRPRRTWYMGIWRHTINIRMVCRQLDQTNVI
jgi:hypothetical protein